MVTLAAGFAGAAIVGGLCLLVIGLIPTDAPPPRPAGRLTTRLHRVRDSRTVVKVGVAVVAGMAVLLLTGWPVAALAAASAVWIVPLVIGNGRANATRLARLSALQEWVRRLADSLTAQAGLEQALIGSARTAPAGITDAVNTLAARIRAQWPTEAALRAFADDIDEATGDLVAAQLILGSRRRGAGLAQVLTGLANTVAADVAMRRQIEADRAKPRTAARVITIVTLLMVVAMMFNQSYLEPYGTALGQVVLAVVIAGFAGVLSLMQKMTAAAPEPRFLTGAAVGKKTGGR